MIYKRSSAVLLSIALFFMACTGSRQQTLQLDVQKSRVLWSMPRNLMGGHYGYFLFQSGNLTYTEGEPVKGTFYMDMNSIRSIDNPTEAGNKKKDAEIRSNQFFASGKHPLATMEVKTITRIDTSMHYRVAGDLTIKGITQPIAFTATINTKGDTSHITASIDIPHMLWDIGQKTYDKHRVDSLSAIREKILPSVHVALDITMHK